MGPEGCAHGSKSFDSARLAAGAFARRGGSIQMYSLSCCGGSTARRRNSNLAHMESETDCRR